MTTVDNIDKEIKAVQGKLQEAINIAASRDIACNRLDERIKALQDMRHMLNGEGDKDAVSDTAKPKAGHTAKAN